MKITNLFPLVAKLSTSPAQKSFRYKIIKRIMSTKKRLKFPNDVKMIDYHFEDIVSDIYHHTHDMNETDCEDALEEIMSFPQVAELLKRKPHTILSNVPPIYKTLSLSLFTFIMIENLLLLYQDCVCKY